MRSVESGIRPCLRRNCSQASPNRKHLKRYMSAGRARGTYARLSARSLRSNLRCCACHSSWGAPTPTSLESWDCRSARSSLACGSRSLTCALRSRGGDPFCSPLGGRAFRLRKRRPPHRARCGGPCPLAVLPLLSGRSTNVRGGRRSFAACSCARAHGTRRAWPCAQGDRGRPPGARKVQIATPRARIFEPSGGRKAGRATIYGPGPMVGHLARLATTRLAPVHAASARRAADFRLAGSRRGLRAQRGLSSGRQDLSRRRLRGVSLGFKPTARCDFRWSIGRLGRRQKVVARRTVVGCKLQLNLTTYLEATICILSSI